MYVVILLKNESFDDFHLRVVGQISFFGMKPSSGILPIMPRMFLFWHVTTNSQMYGLSSPEMENVDPFVRALLVRMVFHIVLHRV